MSTWNSFKKDFCPTALEEVNIITLHNSWKIWPITTFTCPWYSLDPHYHGLCYWSASSKCTVIWVLLDQFSKMVHYLVYPHNWMTGWVSYLGLIFPTITILGNPVGLCPFFIMYGQHPPLPLPDALPSEVPAVNSLVRDFFCIWQDTKLSLSKGCRFKSQADRRQRPSPLYDPSDKICLSSKYICLKTPCFKLAPQFLSLFSIIKQLNPVTYKLCIPVTLRVPNNFMFCSSNPWYTIVFPVSPESDRPTRGSSTGPKLWQSNVHLIYQGPIGLGYPMWSWL